MKTIPSSKIQSLILTAALSIGPGFVSPVSAFVSSYIVDTHGPGVTLLGFENQVYGINDAGQAVGYTDSGEGWRGFITGPNGVGMTELGTLGGIESKAFGINDAGQVVGGFLTNPVDGHAFITGPNGQGMTDLGTLGGGNSSTANDINNTGRVVGTSQTADGSYHHAFITGPNGQGMTDLGTLGGNFSVASAINDAGQVAGWADPASGAPHAFITGPNGRGMTNLGTLGGGSSFASGINDVGQVVGWSDTAADQRHAFVTGPNGQGMADLETLGGDYSSASGINDAGQVVGWSTTAVGAQHAFITGPNGAGMTDLNSLVELPAGIVLVEAVDINNAGQVTAITGYIPEPQSYALMLAGLILVGFMVRRKRLPA